MHGEHQGVFLDLLKAPFVYMEGLSQDILEGWQNDATGRFFSIIVNTYLRI